VLDFNGRHFWILDVVDFLSASVSSISRALQDWKNPRDYPARWIRGNFRDLAIPADAAVGGDYTPDA